jgi:hypothetical protein
MMTSDDRADIVLWNVRNGESRALSTTATFNWQQGSQLQWLGPDFDTRFIFNDYRDGRYVSVIHGRDSGEEKVLPYPVYSVSNDGCWAVCVNYERLHWCRLGYSYAIGGDPEQNRQISDTDGITLLNLKTGKTRLIISTSQMVEMNHLSSMDTGDNYLEHVLFSPNAERFFFFHRWRTEDGDGYTRAYTAQRDGSDIRLINDSGDASHYAWQGDENILLFASHKACLNVLRRSRFLTKYLLRPLRPLFKVVVRPGTGLEKKVLPSRYQLIDALSGKSRTVAPDILAADGHPSFMPGQPGVFVSDTYQDSENYRHLFVFDIANNSRIDIGRFYSPPEFNDTAFRCDLHPRWGRRGRHVCIDSVHSGSRQMHVYSVPQGDEIAGGL